MKIQQIRNATIRITFGGKTFLVDPWLTGKGEMGSFMDIPGHPYTLPDPVKEMLPMPLFPLPMKKEEVLAGVDGYIVTHIHPDHIDMAADGTVGAPLDHNLPVFVQDEADKAIFQKSGFKDVRVLRMEGSQFGSVTLFKTPARHGVISPCGNACGVILQAADEKTLYAAGDTIWYEAVQKTLETYKPAVIVLNCCAAETVENGRLIMNDEDVEAVARTMPSSRLFLTHMDNVAHATITRYTMRGYLTKRRVENYRMPEDGECLEF